MIGPTFVKGQSVSSKHENTCGRNSPVIFPLHLDSVRRQVIVDSVNQLLIGRWQLTAVSQRAFTEMPTPEQQIEMLIDKKGYTTIYRQGKPILQCRFAANVTFYRLRCEADHAARAYFHLREPVLSEGKYDVPLGQYMHPNRLGICKDTLVFSSPTSIGPIYSFKRLAPIQSKH